MEREQQGQPRESGANSEKSRGSAGITRRTLTMAGGAVAVLVSSLAMGLSGASGCGDVIDSKGQPAETAGLQTPEA
ncbi:MAG: hypothetical protein U0359_40605, partial [Byssovorax sp.]